MREKDTIFGTLQTSVFLTSSHAMTISFQLAPLSPHGGNLMLKQQKAIQRGCLLNSSIGVGKSQNRDDVHPVPLRFTFQSTSL
jgi:hypothetical protein